MVAGGEPNDPPGATTDTGPHPAPAAQAFSCKDPSAPSKYTFWLWLSGSKLVAGAELSVLAGATTETWFHRAEGVHEISRSDPSVPGK